MFLNPMFWWILLPFTPYFVYLSFCLLFLANNLSVLLSFQRINYFLFSNLIKFTFSNLFHLFYFFGHFLFFLSCIYLFSFYCCMYLILWIFWRTALAMFHRFWKYVYVGLNSASGTKICISFLLRQCRQS